jgi:hypothetical protein
MLSVLLAAFFKFFLLEADGLWLFAYDFFLMTNDQ